MTLLRNFRHMLREDVPTRVEHNKILVYRGVSACEANK